MYVVLGGFYVEVCVVIGFGYMGGFKDCFDGFDMFGLEVGVFLVVSWLGVVGIIFVVVFCFDVYEGVELDFGWVMELMVDLGLYLFDIGN